MKNKMLSLLSVIILGLSSQLAQAETIKSGSVVCVEEDSLVALQEAIESDNQSALGWLLDGAACMQLREDIEVRVLTVSTGENTEITTIRKRRNEILWTHASSLADDGIALAATQE